MARELAGLALALIAAACGKGSDAAGKGVASGPPLAGKAFYRVDAGPASACTVGAACEAHLVLTALTGYHINREYPFKFVGEAPPAAAVDGTGAFAVDDATHGTMTVRFHPAAAGTARVAGAFKLSVCSDDTCEIETPRIELAIAVR